MLTGPDLAAMRTVASSALPGTAIIQGTTYVSDGGGGGTTGWAAAGTVACRIAPIVSTGVGEEREGDRIYPDSEAIVTLPFDTVVDENDRLVIDGTTYNVTSLRDRSWPVTKRVEVKRFG